MLIDILSENIEYEVANDFSLVNGTSLQGTVNATYSTLENLFGKPTFTTGDPYEKTQMEWVIDGKVYFTDQWGDKDFEYIKATVYNWKTGGSTPTDEYQWHVGGHDYEAVDFVDAIIKGKIEPYFNLD